MKLFVPVYPEGVSIQQITGGHLAFCMAKDTLYDRARSLKLNQIGVELLTEIRRSQY